MHEGNIKENGLAELLWNDCRLQSRKRKHLKCCVYVTSQYIWWKKNNAKGYIKPESFGIVKSYSV